MAFISFLPDGCPLDGVHLLLLRRRSPAGCEGNPPARPQRRGPHHLILGPFQCSLAGRDDRSSDRVPDVTQRWLPSPGREWLRRPAAFLRVAALQPRAAGSLVRFRRAAVFTYARVELPTWRRGLRRTGMRLQARATGGCGSARPPRERGLARGPRRWGSGVTARWSRPGAGHVGEPELPDALRPFDLSGRFFLVTRHDGRVGVTRLGSARPAAACPAGGSLAELPASAAGRRRDLSHGRPRPVTTDAPGRTAPGRSWSRRPTGPAGAGRALEMEAAALFAVGQVRDCPSPPRSSSTGCRMRRAPRSASITGEPPGCCASCSPPRSAGWPPT